MPLGVIEWALRLACLIIEGIPPDQRRATALVWWSMWYPVGKLWLSEEQRKQVEAIMKDAL